MTLRSGSMKAPYVSKTLLLNVLLILNIIACVWTREKNLLTLEWFLCILLLILNLLRWPWTGPRI